MCEKDSVKIVKYLNLLKMKKIRVFIILMFLCLCKSMNSQTAILWEKSFGGSGADFGKVICKAQGGQYFYLGGYTNSNDGDISGVHGGMDIFVICFDSNGAIIWQKNYGGNGNDYIHGLLPTQDGGLIMKGYTLSSDLPSYKGGFDIWLVKIDNIGNIQWQKTYGGSDDDGLHAVDLCEHPNGGYIMTASTESADGDITSNKGEGDSWLVRLSSTGNIIWAKNFGGSLDEDTHCVMITPDTGYIVAGHSYSEDGDVSGLHSYGMDDAWVYKTDSSGNLQWQKCIGGSAIELFKTGCAVNGGYIFAGYTNSNDGDIPLNKGDYDAWITKIDENGNILWSKTFGGSYGDYLSSAMQGLNGTIVLSGLTNSNDGDVYGNKGDFDYWVLVLDSLGNLIWQKCLGGPSADRGEFAFPTADSAWLITGFSASNTGDVTFNHGAYDAWTVKLIDCYNLKAVFDYSPSSACVNDAVNIINNSINADSIAWFINGTYWSSLSNPVFIGDQPKKDTIMLVAFSGVCSDTMIKVIEIKPLPYVDLGPDTAICLNCNIILDAANPSAWFLWSTGETTQMINFSKPPDTISVIVDLDGCVAYDTIIIGLVTDVENMMLFNKINIYPNPANNYVNINFNFDDILFYRLIDISGNEIDKGMLNNYVKKINISRLTEGFYLLELNYKGYLSRIKLIKI